MLEVLDTNGNPFLGELMAEIRSLEIQSDRHRFRRTNCGRRRRKPTPPDPFKRTYHKGENGFIYILSNKANPGMTTV